MTQDSCPSLHQSREFGPSIADLREASWRTSEVREKFLLFVEGLIEFATTLLELSEIVMGEDFKVRRPFRHNSEVLQVMLAPQDRAELGLSRRVIIGQRMAKALRKSRSPSRKLGMPAARFKADCPSPLCTAALTS